MEKQGFLVRTEIGERGEQTILRALMIPDDGSEPYEFATYSSFVVDLSEEEKEKLHLLFDKFIVDSNRMFAALSESPLQ